MRFLKYPLLLLAVFIIGVLIMGGNNAYEYKEKSLILAPADTTWKYLSDPQYWQKWNNNIKTVSQSGEKQYEIIMRKPNKGKTHLQILKSSRDSMKIIAEWKNEDFTRLIQWKIKPEMALCSLFVREQTRGNSFLSNARYAFEVEEQEEHTISSYEKLRVLMGTKER